MKCFILINSSVSPVCAITCSTMSSYCAKSPFHLLLHLLLHGPDPFEPSCPEARLNHLPETRMLCSCQSQSVSACHTAKAVSPGRSRRQTGPLHACSPSQRLVLATAVLRPASKCGGTGHCRSRARLCQRSVCRAKQEEEKEKDMVGGFDVDSPAGFLESEAVGLAFTVSLKQDRCSRLSCLI